MTTKQRTIRWRTSAWAGLVTLAVVFFANGARANEGTLERLLDKLDMKLYEQSEADIRAWLDARIEAAGGFPVYPWNGNGHLRGESVGLDLNRGALADSAAQLFRAYEMLGDKKYLEAGLKTADFWLKAQEHPDGWAAEYTYDGHEAWTQRHKTYRYDQPETWPGKIEAAAAKDGQPWYSRSKVQLEDTGKMYDLLQEGGREALLKWYKAPTKYDEADYLAARLAAARRCNDEDMQVVVHDLKRRGVEAAVKANYLDRVRLRLAAPGGKSLPSSDSLGRSGLASQSWFGPHTWYEPYRPPYGWASWQYVWDARLALGMIDADTATAGGRGLENMHCWPAWDVIGDWTTRCLEVENWLDVPLADLTD